VQVLDKAQIDAPEIYRSDELMESYKLATGYEFKRFTSSKAFKSLRRNGLLFV